MGINSVNDYSSYLQNYKVPTIPAVRADELKAMQRKAEETDAASVASAAGI